jgi:hypothetical protein
MSQDAVVFFTIAFLVTALAITSFAIKHADKRVSEAKQQIEQKGTE